MTPVRVPAGVREERTGHVELRHSRLRRCAAPFLRIGRNHARRRQRLVNPGKRAEPCQGGRRDLAPSGNPAPLRRLGRGLATPPAVPGEFRPSSHPSNR